MYKYLYYIANIANTTITISLISKIFNSNMVDYYLIIWTRKKI